MPNEIEIPAWVNDTPPDHSYSLTMFQNSDSSIQDIELTREEYIALKEHLAAMRGYVKPDETAAASA